MRTRIYIAGPISSGDLLENIANAELVFDVLVDLGYAPIIPHMSCFMGQVLRGHKSVEPQANAMAISHEIWLEIDYSLLSTCSAVIRISGKSPGADKEELVAEFLNIPVFRISYHHKTEIMEESSKKAVYRQLSQMIKSLLEDSNICPTYEKEGKM